MSILACINNQKNIGKSSCKKIPQLIKGMITTPDDFSLTFTQAADSSNWQTALLAAKSSRIYLWPTAVNFEAQNEEAVYQDTPLSTISVRDGRYRYKLSFLENLQVHKAMYSHKNFSGRVFLIDNENKIIGTELANGNFAGFSIDLLNPEKLKLNDGSNATMSPVYVSLEDNRELDEYGAMIEGTFLKTLVPLTSVEIAVSNATAAGMTATVTSSLDLVEILGLVQADFVLLDENGAAQVIDAVVDNEDGTYTLTGAGLTSGTLNLVSAANLSVKGFESSGSATVTVV